MTAIRESVPYRNIHTSVLYCSLFCRFILSFILNSVSIHLFLSLLSFSLSSLLHRAGTAQTDSLQAGRSGGSNPGGGRDFLHPSRPAPRATQSPIQWTGSLLRGQSGRGVALTHPLPSSEVKGRIELHLYSPSGPPWPILSRTLPYLTLCRHAVYL